HREVGAEVEELVLDALEVLTRHDACPADQRVELVDGAVRLHERVQLGDTGSIAEGRLSRIAATRVDPRQPHRLVGLPAHDLRPRSSRGITRRWISLVPSQLSVTFSAR